MQRTPQASPGHPLSHLLSHSLLLHHPPLSGAKDAKLIGIEYIISERLFLELPDEEKQ